MAELSEAYDFALFEDRPEGNVLPLEDPRQREHRRNNVIELPQQELEKNRRPKHHPLRAMAVALCFSLVFTAVTLTVYNQVWLTELTEEISTTTEQLNEARSVEVQLNMQASEKMNGTQVEEYVKSQLGMTKLSEEQISFVNVVRDDKGVVVQDVGSTSLWDSIVSTVRSWFS